jgi:uncharacterized protein (TIGR01777 family)
MTKTGRKKIIITGATGFIGKELVRLLTIHYRIVIITRNIDNAKRIFGDNVNITYCDQNSEYEIIRNIEGAHGIINLAGENVGYKRWTKRQKVKIINSRISIGNKLTRAIEKANKKPEVFIQASAIGYYGIRDENTIDEVANISRDGFLAEVAKAWEKSTVDIASGVRYIIIRLGIVLGKEGGILKNILLPFRYFLGGYPGKGMQWISWIHINDMVKAVLFILKNSQLSGVYNLTAPEPVQFKYLAKAIGRILKRPVWISVPKIILIILFGQRARELFLGSTLVYPERLLADNFNTVLLIKL